MVQGPIGGRASTALGLLSISCHRNKWVECFGDRVCGFHIPGDIGMVSRDSRQIER